MDVFPDDDIDDSTASSVSSTTPSLESRSDSTSTDSDLLSFASDELSAFLDESLVPSLMDPQDDSSAESSCMPDLLDPLDSLSISSSLDDELDACLFDPVVDFPSQRLLSAELEAMLTHLDLESSDRVLITPKCAAVSTEHLVDSKMYVRPVQSSALHSADDTSRVYPVLVDTGCSVACTGFLADFEGSLINGDFGSIKTANGLASIEGFGLVRWHTVTEFGQPIVI